VYSTPKGELREVRRKQVKGLASAAVSPYWSEYLLKEVEDLQSLKYVLENQTFEFDRELYERVKSEVGGRAPPTVGCPPVPIANLTIRCLGLLKTTIWLRKYPNEVDEILQVMDNNNGRFLETVEKSPIPIVNFEDNIDQNLFSPSIFIKYILPYYKERTAELHASNKLCTAHWDGKLKSLLQYAKETGLDGIECITPQPQGDVTLEEIHSALVDIILLDGLPAISFLPSAKDNELQAMTRKVLQMFTPRLVLGVSDLVPPNASIEKIRLVTKIVQEFRNG
jgi:uroporphyrinogen-III decarboxylase